jgi:hypothetical protein
LSADFRKYHLDFSLEPFTVLPKRLESGCKRRIRSRQQKMPLTCIVGQASAIHQQKYSICYTQTASDTQALFDFADRVAHREQPRAGYPWTLIERASKCPKANFSIAHISLVERQDSALPPGIDVGPPISSSSVDARLPLVAEVRRGALALADDFWPSERARNLTVLCENLIESFPVVEHLSVTDSDRLIRLVRLFTRLMVNIQFNLQ